MPKTSRRSIKSKTIICAQCKIEIKEEGDAFIECDKCYKALHSQCTKMDKRQFDYLLKNNNVLFTCHFCDSGEEGEGELKTELKEIKAKLAKLDQLSAIQESNNNIQEAVKFMSQQYDEILKGVAENGKKLREIEKENSMLRKEVDSLKTSVKLLNDVRVKNDCIVRGLNAVENASAVECVLEFTKSVAPDIKAENIEEAYFVGGMQNGDNRKKTAVVKFSDRASKNKLMAVKPKLKENESTKSVFVNDFLSKETLELFNYAKSIKEVGYQIVFVKNGRVMYKRSAISRPQVIRSEQEVDEIILNATTNKRYSHSTRMQKKIIPVEDDDGPSADEDDQIYASPNNK